jgi:hypothetical protein
VAPRARVLLGGAEAGEDDEEAVAVAEAVARTEAEAPTGTLSGGEAVAVAVAEAGRAGRLSDAADGREPPDEQPPKAGTACSPRC